MKPKTLLVLALVVAALGAFVWFYERKLPSTEERAEQSKKVLAVKSADVEAIDIAWGEQAVRLEREPTPAKRDAAPADTAAAPATWRIVSPIQATADRFAVERLLDSLTGLEKQRTLEAPDRKELGLDAPRATVELGTAKGKTALQIGADLPASNAMAVAIGGSPDAFVVSNGVFADLTKAPGDWRSKDLFTATREDISRVALEGAGQKVLFAKRGEEYWLESPLTDRADRDAVGRLLGDLTGLRAANFLDTPDKSLAEMGLAPPQGAVEAVLAGKSEPFRVELGMTLAADPNRRYGRAGGLLFDTDSKLFDSLTKAAESWRSPAWSGLEVYRVDQASFADAAGQLDVARDGPDWRRGKDLVSFTPVSDLLYALSSARADRLLSQSEAARLGAALSAPAFTATLTASDKSVETLTLYPPLADGAVPGMASGRDTVLLLPKSAADDVRSKLETLRKAEPMAEKKDAEKTP